MKYINVNWEDFNSHREDLEIEGEEWKTSHTINEKMGSGNLFEVSNYGRVRRSDTRFVYTISDNLPQVNHKPSGLGKFDNRVEHLEWCTEKDNIKDAHKNGQMTNRTKVNTQVDRKSDIFIEEMYRRYKDTGQVGSTAREFEVPRTTLSSIVNKRSRVEITDRVDLEYLQEKQNE